MEGPKVTKYATHSLPPSDVLTLYLAESVNLPTKLSLMLFSKVLTSLWIHGCTKICWKWKGSWIGQWWGRRSRFRMLYLGTLRYVWCWLYLLLVTSERVSPQTTRTLRLFLNHTVSGQVWQAGAEAGGVANFETGEGIPAWTFKIEGRLLEVCITLQTHTCISMRISSSQPPNLRSRDKLPQRKFSTLIKRMVVELDRDPTLYPDGNIVEVLTIILCVLCDIAHLKFLKVASRIWSPQSRARWLYC
jgi:hypothetical protein